jgi:hypothetical protein
LPPAGGGRQNDAVLPGEVTNELVVFAHCDDAEWLGFLDWAYLLSGPDLHPEAARVHSAAR